MGETCEEYDARRSKTMKADAKSEKVVAKTTKVCPNKECGRRINKNGGCNHMWCMYFLFFDFLEEVEMGWWSREKEVKRGC